MGRSSVCQRWWGGAETKEEAWEKPDGNDGAASVEGGGGLSALPLSMTARVILLKVCSGGRQHKHTSGALL